MQPPCLAPVVCSSWWLRVSTCRVEWGVVRFAFGWSPPALRPRARPGQAGWGSSACLRPQRDVGQVGQVSDLVGRPYAAVGVEEVAGQHDIGQELQVGDGRSARARDSNEGRRRQAMNTQHRRHWQHNKVLAPSRTSHTPDKRGKPGQERDECRCSSTTQLAPRSRSCRCRSFI